jgi:hypothetical protein
MILTGQIKRLLRNLGRFFLVFRQKYEKDLRQSVLLVGGEVVPTNNVELFIQNVKKRFVNAKLVVLTSEDRKGSINDNFADIEIIVSNNKDSIKGLQLAIQLLLLLLRRRFDFILLPSLDISLVLVSLLFARCPVILHNRWMDWYRLRQRTVLDVLQGTKSTDNRRRKNRGIKGILKSFGRIFVVLSDMKEEDIICHILVEDNGYTELGHIRTAVKRAREIFINPDITMVIPEVRKRYFLDMLPDIKLFTADLGNDRYGLAKQILRMRKIGFDRIILTTLDISPVIVSLLFMRTKVLLYNKWHQWWNLEIKDVRGYLEDMLKFLITIPIFVYLLISAIFALSRTRLRLISLNCCRERQ